jgi:mRNA-degrading endonuclease YafQ of YafQ-DinJ toxin-antitoxin module
MEETTATTKICSRCKETKTVDEFYKDKNIESGYCPYCKKCAKQRREEQKLGIFVPEDKSARTSKICSKCKIEKPMETFNKNLRNQDGHCSVCKECRIEKTKEKIVKIKEMNENGTWSRTTKICTKCKIEKPIEDFIESKIKKDGHYPSCKECQNKKSNEFYHKNRESMRSASNKRYSVLKNCERKTFKISKICKDCNKEKQISEFYNYPLSKDGYSYSCIECEKEYSKKRKEKNKNKKFETKKSKKCIKCNIEKTIDSFYRNNSCNDGHISTCKECHTKEAKENRNKNKDRYNEISKLRLQDPQKRLKSNISGRIRSCLLQRLSGKNGRKTFKNILPYTIEELMKSLEHKFQPGMTWQNYGKGPGKWSLNHCQPDSAFVYNSVDDEEFLESWALSNLQPLWDNENSSKGNRYAGKPDAKIPMIKQPIKKSYKTYASSSPNPENDKEGDPLKFK